MKIKSVTYAGKADVYNMEVEDTHDFVIQGGVISHNCLDATRYFCMLRQVAPARIDHNRTAIANDPLSDDNLIKANNASTAPWRR